MPVSREIRSNLLARLQKDAMSRAKNLSVGVYVQSSLVGVPVNPSLFSASWNLERGWQPPTEGMLEVGGLIRAFTAR